MNAQSQIREIGNSINVDFTMKIDEKNYRFLDLWTWESADAEKLEMALKTAGFKGRILYTGRYEEDGDEEVSDWSTAASDYGIAPQFIPLRSDEEFPEQKECGFATKKGGSESVFPGPYMMFPAFLQKKLDEIIDTPAASKFVTRFVIAPDGGRKDAEKDATTPVYWSMRG